LYPGWAPNPVVLPEGINHSPAYDGDDLYVGTADPSFANGEIYRIDAATGAILWSFASTNIPGDGYAAGVGLDGDYVYFGSNGGRGKLEKAGGAVVWEFTNNRTLYGTPAIGRNFIYVNQDNTGPGVLVVEKGGGAALYNFASDGVGMVTQHPTLYCDNYLSVGDRDGRWWMLDINNQEAEWYYQFSGIVNQTAVASGSDIAVVSVRSGNTTNGGGQVIAFQLNAGARARAQQNVISVDIPVPFGTGAGNAYCATDAICNVGCAPLDITGVTIVDPPPDVVASRRAYNDALERKAAAMANVMVGPDYTAYFDAPTKAAMITNHINDFVTDELTRGDVRMEEATRAMANSQTASNRMAAGAAIVRTSNVTYTTPLAPGECTDVCWLYDGTGLERGRDVEEIHITTNAPDEDFCGISHPIITVNYIGGCLDDEGAIVWNTLGAENQEMVYNYGSIGDDDTDDDLLWGADPNGADAAMMYDGTFILAGAVPPTADSAQFYYGNVYDQWDNSTFLGNPNPANGVCEIIGATDVHMGWRRTGGCPGTPVEILGAWTRSWFVDSNMAFAGTVYEAIGVDIQFTEYGAYDPLFGDFAILIWELTERFGDTEGPIYGGTFCDWDIPADYDENHGIVSPNFNGYALWDHVTPGLAYGFLDPRQYTIHCDVDPTIRPPHRCQEMGQDNPGGTGGAGGYGLWQGDGVDDLSLLWDDVVNGAQFESGPHEGDGAVDPTWEDHFGLLVSQGVNLGPYETDQIVQAKFAVDASSNDDATIEALAMDVARRAAVWIGSARGDVNFDYCVNLQDVCWILSGNQVYPDWYNGDVDGDGIFDAPADAWYLLQYVTSIGPPPVGGCRMHEIAP
jgi:hypothetical protein